VATVLKESGSARIHRQLDHPVVDADGHWMEPVPILWEYVRETGGARAIEGLQAWRARADNFYKLSPAERQRRRMNRSLWWGAPASAIDRATAMTPRLMYERLADFGVDFAIVYPTLGLRFTGLADEELRRSAIRAYNIMAAEMFKPLADRMTPVAVIPSHTPEEALAEIDFVVNTLGLKSALLNTTVARPIEADAEWQPDPSRRRYYIDCLGMDSPYDYEPVWARFRELKLAVTTHGGSLGWVNRTSPTSYVCNHLGHFAQANQTAARTLFMGGVTQRHPGLNFAFLEGGIGWACTLYTDLIAHWQKRGRQFIKRMDPAKLDVQETLRLLREYGYDEATVQAIANDNLDCRVPFKSLQELEQRDLDGDDFWGVDLNSKEDFERLFAEPFYFGCEPDDPSTAWAFDAKAKGRLKPIFSSDISHFDVPDMTEVLEEAYELVEDGLLTHDNFRDFTFTNAVKLHSALNRDFFKGTAIESAAASV
jgi:predicted TIM-barrel fold metal-dependent hydrolase